MKSEIDVKMDEPTLVAVSEIGESQWGVHQFPQMSRLPDGSIQLSYADAEDSHNTHGEPAPAYVSRDEGESWEEFQGEPTPIRPHFSVSEVFGGEHLIMPANYAELPADLDLPPPVAEGKCYVTRRSYKVSELPEDIREFFGVIPSKRFSPVSGEWNDDIVKYDMRNRLLTLYDGSAHLLTRTFFEHPLLKFGDELMFADYRSSFLSDDGAAPPLPSSHLMVSDDNGKLFKRRSTIAADLTGEDSLSEAVVAGTADGDLVSVIRRTDHRQKSMLITWSKDRGNTWEIPNPLDEFGNFGVFPKFLLLGNGVLVLSYGRPGVHIRFAVDGSGREWSKKPLSVIPDDGLGIEQSTCGYTSLLALSDDSFLITYSDFKYRDSDGNQRKAIFTRKIQL